jgi:hypothetical protein
MKPLYISATLQDCGKTTVIVGLMEALRKSGHDVGYMKPVGQRYVQFEGANIDEDAILARHVFHLKDVPADMSPIAVERGFTERYIYHRDPAPLEARVKEACGRLRAAHSCLIIEGTGHAGVGSCFDLSNARVAELLGAPVIIITEGGIGRAIDEVALSLHLFRKHNVQILGVILNKTWPQKLEKIQRAVATGLAHLGTRLLGVIPFRAQLGYPRMEQIAVEMGGKVLCGRQNIGNIIEHTVVAAMAPQHVCSYIRQNTLVITPGDRIDNILISITACPIERGLTRPVTGILLTGGFEPPASILSLIESIGIPVVLCQDDTYTVAAHLQEMRFKIRPEDADKVEAAKALIRENVNVPDLLARLADDA